MIEYFNWKELSFNGKIAIGYCFISILFSAVIAIVALGTHNHVPDNVSTNTLIGIIGLELILRK